MKSLTKRQKNRINACIFAALTYAAMREVMGFLLGWFMPGGEMLRLAVNALVNFLALFLPCLVILVLEPMGNRQLRLRPCKKGTVWFWLPIFLGGGALVNLASLLLRPLDNSAQEILPGGLGAMGMVFLIYCVIPAVGEELLFRGIMEGILTPCGKGIAIFLPALFFSLLHGRVTQGFVAFFTGLFLGWLAWRQGSILPGMALHFVNNLIAVVEIYLTQFASWELAAAFQWFHFIFWPVAGGILLVKGIRRGILKREDPQPESPGPFTVFTVPACGLTAAALLLLQLMGNF